MCIRDSCNIGDWVSLDGYSAVGLNTNELCNDLDCDFEVVGVADHSICTLSGSIGNDNFTHTYSGVFMDPDYMQVTWAGVTGFPLSSYQGESLSVQVTCGQGIVAAD